MSTEVSPSVEERDAVYYPFIHLRDRAWLNGTLLYFPHLVRMVPGSYPLKDEPWVVEYRETAGRGNKPLLETIDFWQDEVKAAHERLALRVREDIDRDGSRFRQRFSRAAAEKEARSFRISENRLAGIGASPELYRALKENDLVWHSSPGEYGIHPVLGEAIMATVAMAVAERDGMDVVTPSAHVHDVLAARRSDAVYDALVRSTSAPTPPKSELVDDLASIVLIQAFDVEKLEPATIAKLHADGEDLTSFRSELAKHLATMAMPQSRKVREALLHEKAAEVLEKWREHTSSWSAFGRKLFSKELLNVPREAAAAVTGGLIGGAPVSLALVAGGLIVGVVWHAGSTAIDVVGQAKKSPYRWLNRIHRAGAKQLPVPLWESRIALPSGQPKDAADRIAPPNPHG